MLNTIFGIITVISLMWGAILCWRAVIDTTDPPEDRLLWMASDLHGDQKYDTHPYAYHLRAVLENVEKYSSFYGDDPELMAALRMAGIFHDTLEDVPSYTYNDLKEDARKVFLDEFYVNMVAEIVYACTTDKGRNRKERAGDKYYAGIRDTGYAPFIKACDRLANISYAVEHKSKMAKVYIQELPEFLKNITKEDNPIPPDLKDALCQFLQD